MSVVASNLGNWGKQNQYYGHIIYQKPSSALQCHVEQWYNVHLAKTDRTNEAYPCFCTTKQLGVSRDWDAILLLQFICIPI